MYPEGIYDYGQIGIGTCLAGPTDMRWVGDGSVLAITNGNPWVDFSGGSLLMLDVDSIDLGAGSNLISALDAHAFALPSFVGALDDVPALDMVVVTDRYSGEARTRESNDLLHFIDVSDPSTPRGADVAEDGDTLSIGYDPSAVVYDNQTEHAYVVNRTSHEVAIVDMSSTPFERVFPPGPGTLEDAEFVDEGSGSHAEFVELTIIPAALPDAHSWDLSWSEAAIRVWFPAEGGAYRVTGNGETWARSGLDLDLDVAETDGGVGGVSDPSFLLESGELARMVFLDDGAIRAADDIGFLGNWSFETGNLLNPRATEWDAFLGGPHLVQSNGVWYLYYDGGDGTTQSIGMAASPDGITFSRVGAVLTSDAGESLEDPFVSWDADLSRWRMWFTARGSDGSVSIGEAESVDLTTWTRSDAAIDAGEKPALGYANGRWHLYTQVNDGVGWALQEQTSVDGRTFGAARAETVAIEGVFDEAPGVAIQVQNEGTFRLTNESGEVFPLALTPGDRIDSANDGWRVRVAAGFVVGPDAAPDLGAGGLALSSVVRDTAYLTALGFDGASRIVAAERVDDNLFPLAVPALEPGAGGDFDTNAVSDPVVIEADGGLVMYYAGRNHGVVTIGRAESSDGLVWDAASKPILSATDSFESVEMRPGSVQVLDDGTIRLWYTAFDGDRYRIGAADSSDGVAFTRVPGPEAAWQFDGGAPGEWDDSGVRHPWVVREGDVDHLWFSGFDGDKWQLGYAARTSEGVWEESTDVDGVTRPIMAAKTGSFGTGGMLHPVALATAEGWEIWYTGEDAGVGRVGRAVAVEPDRLSRDTRMPTLADTWGFSSAPDANLTAISLDGVFDGQSLLATGCATIAVDQPRGFVYVGCKLTPMVFVLDVRDDSTESTADWNYLGVEAVLYAGTTTNGDSGFRTFYLDQSRDVLLGLSDDPEALYAIRVDDVLDDSTADFMKDRVLGMIALPRGNERDQGPSTQASVGPAAMAMHPDGRHLFVTNFNDDSVSCIDLALGPVGTLIAQADQVGENPGAILLTGDGRHGFVANYAGAVTAGHASSSLVVIDTDPESPDFMAATTWVVNQ